MRKLAFVLLVLALPVAAHAADCRYSAPRDANLDAIGLQNLVLKLGASDLDIQGVAGLNQVQVRGTACASTAAALESLQVGAKRDGASAAVVVPNDHGFNIGSLFGSRYAYLKLQVRVPATLAIRIESGSADVKAQMK